MPGEAAVPGRAFGAHFPVPAGRVPAGGMVATGGAAVRADGGPVAGGAGQGAGGAPAPLPQRRTVPVAVLLRPGQKPYWRR
jgi:hypothetical protein